MDVNLDGLKQYLRDDINKIEFHTLMSQPVTLAIKGNDITQKEQNFYFLIMDFLNAMMNLDLDNYNKNLEDYYFCQNYTLNEFMVLSTALFNVVTMPQEKEEKNPDIAEFLSWLTDKLLMLFKDEFTEEAIKDFTVAQICGAFYYAPKVYQNDFLVYLHALLLKYLFKEGEQNG